MNRLLSVACCLLVIAGCGSPAKPPSVTVAIAPTNPTLLAGGSVQFVAVVAGTTNQGVTWSVGGNGIAQSAITSAGLFTAPSTAGTYSVIATSQADTSASATATVTVNALPPPVSVDVTPDSAMVLTLGSATFMATVTGTQNTGVTWSVQEGTNGGSISNEGVYTAPAVSGVFHVVATSVADTSKTGLATVTVMEPVSVSVMPATVTVTVGGSQSFTATVTGNVNMEATWSVQEGAAGGTITVGGVYTAPATAGTYHVVATSVADTTKSAIATVTVTTAMVVSVAVMPASVMLPGGGTQQFTATVSGSTNVMVTWSLLEGAAAGGISPFGLYTAPAAAGTYHVVATSLADSTKSSTAVVTDVGTVPVSVSVTPLTATVVPGGTQQFTANVMNSTNMAVAWTVMEGAAGGSVSAGGLYTAPGTTGTYHVIATSQADMTKSATATVTVSGGSTPVVMISPTTAALAPEGMQQFTATVTGTSNTAVTWSVKETSGGSISSAGLYTAPSNAGLFHVVVTTQATPVATATATISVSLPSGPTLSGSILYTGALTGPVYVGVELNGTVNAGDGIPAPGSYSISGIINPQGIIRVVAFMDVLGLGKYVYPADPYIEVQENWTGVSSTADLTLADPPVNTLTAPSGVQVFPSTDSAVVNWSDLQDSMGNDLADHYKIYWDHATGSTCPATLGSFMLAPDAGKPVFVVGLTTGASYCFAVSGIDAGTEGPLSAVTGPIIIQPPTGLTLSGTASVPTTGSTGALYVLAFNNNGIQYDRIPNPANSQTFTITGVAMGEYILAAFLDANNNNQIDATDPGTFNTGSGKTPPAMNATGDVSNIVVSIPTGNSQTFMTTQYDPKVNPGMGYVMNMALTANSKLPLSAALVDGAGVANVVDLGLDPNNGTPGALSTTFSLGSDVPQISQTYSIDVTYTDGSTEVVTPVVEGVVSATAAAVLPTGSVSNLTPTFTWTAPNPAPPSYTYEIDVNTPTGQTLWSLTGMPSSQLSIAYGSTDNNVNNDGNSAQPLMSGMSYIWDIVVTDAYGNSSVAHGSFSEQ